MVKPDALDIILRLAYYPDKALLTQSEPVTDWEMAQYIAEPLMKTMVVHHGFGLSAIQAKMPIQMFVMRCDGIRRTFVNPKILASEDPVLCKEGCLSFPTYSCQVERFNKISIEAFDVFGVPFTMELEGPAAFCAQHEMEHLEGKTFADKLSRLRKAILKSVIKRHTKKLYG